MTIENSIPIVVGITGHRDYGSEDRDVLFRAVCAELAAIKARCPHSPIVMLNSLAEGADTLCAEAAAACSVPVVAVLPMEQAEYAHDFSDEAAARFSALCGAAAQCFVAPPTERAPAAPDRGFAYRQAGVYTATHAHVLLALWDGADESGSDCGTAAIVRCALDGAYTPADGTALSGCCPVIRIVTPRANGSSPEPAGTVHFLGDRAAFEELLDRTDEFNRLAGETASSPAPLLTEHEADACLDRMESLYAKADALSIRNAKQYRRILAVLAVISTVITVAFLLYDEAELHWMILLCGIMFLAGWLVQRFGRRLACHRRYLEYRTLAEALRVQTFLRYAGSRVDVCRLLSWSEQTETAWIAAAMKAVSVGAPPYPAHDIRTLWIEQQRLYHEKAYKRSARSRAASERIVGIALGVSITLYLCVLVFELIWGDLFPFSGHIETADRVRMLSKLILGGISAATLFISNYYGRLSLSRVTADHDKMAAFYAAVRKQFDRNGPSETLFSLLAQEELIENGNWCSYQRDNSADFSL